MLVHIFMFINCILWVSTTTTAGIFPLLLSSFLPFQVLTTKTWATSAGWVLGYSTLQESVVRSSDAFHTRGFTERKGEKIYPRVEHCTCVSFIFSSRPVPSFEEFLALQVTSSYRTPKGSSRFNWQLRWNLPGDRTVCYMQFLEKRKILEDDRTKHFQGPWGWL